MTSHALSQHSPWLLGGTTSSRENRQLRRNLAVSVLIHVCVLAVIAGLRLNQTGERPLAAVQVSLVSMPTPTATVDARPQPPAKTESPPVRPIPVPPQVRETAKAAEPAPVQRPVPVQQAPPKETPAPPVKSVPVAPPIHVPTAPLVQMAKVPTPPLAPIQPTPLSTPAPASPPRSDAQVPRRASGNTMRDVLKDIELPPNAPEFGDISPSKPVARPRHVVPPRPERSPEQLRRDVDTLLSKLQVPEVPVPPPQPKVQPKPVAPPTPHTSVSQELNPDLEKLEKEMKKLSAPAPVRVPEPPREFKPMFEKQPPMQAPIEPVPPVTASVPRTKTPDTVLKVQGAAPGSNAYLARVQARISSMWTAPPVDVSGSQLTVVIRFRLHRSGVVSGVAIEQSSGNDYYDLSGKRAVLSADPLPTFPQEITESYFDAHFTFAVGTTG